MDGNDQENSQKLLDTYLGHFNPAGRSDNIIQRILVTQFLSLLHQNMESLS